MAMYMRQKEVQDMVLAWIKEACILMIETDCSSKANSISKSQDAAPGPFARNSFFAWTAVCTFSLVFFNNKYPAPLQPLYSTYSTRPAIEGCVVPLLSL
jgi:hypothetical protein